MVELSVQKFGAFVIPKGLPRLKGGKVRGTRVVAEDISAKEAKSDRTGGTMDQVLMMALFSTSCYVFKCSTIYSPRKWPARNTRREISKLKNLIEEPSFLLVKELRVGAHRGTVRLSLSL